ncbi:MAG: hypothetical protein HY216_06695, partial [Candidatus Rokubacteria bacterium]|nr:hypothetical protein [Candidatus Rokubacteria bacterium]
MFRSMLIVAITMLFASPAAAQTTPPDNGEAQHAQRLEREAKTLDAAAARAGTPQGQQRVADAIATQFKVDQTVVNDLRAKNLGFGEVTITLGLAQELVKKDPTLTQQQAIDKILAQRASGRGWGVIARDMDLKLGKIVSEVKRVDRRVERVARVEKAERREAEKAERAERVERVEKAEKAERAERPEKLEKVEKPEKVEKAQRAERVERVERVERSG